MKARSMLLVLLSLVLIPISASAWDTRILALGDPALTMGDAVPSGYTSFVGFYPTDGYAGVGLSIIPDAVDIFVMPQALGNEKLFPSNGLVVDWAGGAPNGGLIYKPTGAMTFALFLLAPANYGFAIGTPRGAFNIAGGGNTSFALSSTLAAGITTPASPANIADFFFSYKLGNIVIGASAGFAYSLAAGGSTNISGTANSTTNDNSSAWAATGRAGVSMPLGPVGFDASVVVVGANTTATRTSGAAAAVPNLNNSLTATNIALAVNTRGTLPLGDKFDLGAVANFATLPQNFSASNAAGSISTTTAFIDPSGLWSAGAGTGITWKASDTIVITGYLGAIVGEGNWINIAPGVTPRPGNSILWVTLKPLLNGEFKPAPWITLRGGFTYTGQFTSSTVGVNTGGTAATSGSWTTSTTATAGCTLQLMDKATLEMLINLGNFNAAGGALLAPFAETSLKLDL